MGQQYAQGARLASATLMAALAVAAVGRVSAGGPPLRQANAPAGRCRAYATDETRLSKTGTLQVKCTYETSTNRHICRERYSGSSAYSFVQTTQFGSIADFVGDPSKVSFLPRAKTIVIAFPTSTSTQTYSYDARGRLASIVTLSTAGAGGSMVQTFTAWDAFGRPTLGRDANQTYALTYNNAQRVTMTAGGAVMSVKLDANSNQVETTTVSPSFRDTATIQDSRDAGNLQVDRPTWQSWCSARRTTRVARCAT